MHIAFCSRRQSLQRRANERVERRCSTDDLGSLGDCRARFMRTKPERRERELGIATHVGRPANLEHGRLAGDRELALMECAVVAVADQREIFR